MPAGRAVAIIPARGGSKGIPRKNVRPFLGLPLVTHSIAHALATPEIDTVYVTTDDDEIAAVSRAAGAQVIHRPAELASDTASSESALLHALDAIEAAQGLPEWIVFLQATSPLRPPGILSEALRAVEARGADSLLSGCALEGFVWRAQGDALRALTYDPTRRPRRQDIGRDYLENGSFYVCRARTLRETGNRLGGKTTVFEMHPLDSFQLDRPEDLELLERVARLRPASHLPPRPGLLALDFDGVLTDNTVYLSADGVEQVRCSRADGLGLAALRRAGVPVVVLSSETDPVVRHRCAKLGIPCQSGLTDKLAALVELAAAEGVDARHVAFVGNDRNDVPCLRWAGYPVAVADAEVAALAAARYVTTRRGGRGAVRELCDAWLGDGPPDATDSSPGHQGATP